MHKINKLICLDFGNTRLKGAYYENSIFKADFNIINDDPKNIENILNLYQPQTSILSSVIQHNVEVEAVLQKNTKFHLLTNQSKLNFTTPVNKPSSIGTDRIALIAGGIELFPDSHILIICIGTCITYNFVNIFQEFLGGNISPGLTIRLKSLHDNTAKLPLLEFEANFPKIGYDTKTNIISGVVLGLTYEINGIIEDYLNKYSKINVILTGGDMDFFVNRLKYKIFADPNLLFNGLKTINEKNN